MEEKTTHLRLFDSASIGNEIDLVSEFFHRINRVIPEDQKVEAILPTCLVREAIDLLNSRGFSQVPVVLHGTVLGVFSYRSFAKKTATMTRNSLHKLGCDIGELSVDEFMEDFEFARVTDEMKRFFEAMDRDNGLLIGEPDNLIGVLTPMDFLNYFYKVANPFVLVCEIELALRGLIQQPFSEEELSTAISRSVGKACEGQSKIPMRLDEMTFGNYETLFHNPENWRILAPVFGCRKPVLLGRLKEVAGIRNSIFHFRGDASPVDHQTLVEHRNWFLNKVKQAQLQRGKGTIA